MLNKIREIQEKRERDRISKEFLEFMTEKFDDNSMLEIALERAKPMFDGSVSVEAHLAGLKDRLDDAALDELVGKNQGELVAVYRKINEAFERHRLIDIHRLASIPKDVDRINQIEVIIDLYNLKLSRTKNDTTISEEEKNRKLQALEHLMEKDIGALGGAL